MVELIGLIVGVVLGILYPLKISTSMTLYARASACWRRWTPGWAATGPDYRGNFTPEFFFRAFWAILSLRWH